MNCPLSSVKSFLCDDNLEHALYFTWQEITSFSLGLFITLVGVIGFIVNCCYEKVPKRSLKEQIARLRDYQVRDPVCHLKGRLLGVKTQDWKDYFSMPAPMLTNQKKKSERSKKPEEKQPVSEKRERTNSSDAKATKKV